MQHSLMGSVYLRVSPVWQEGRLPLELTQFKVGLLSVHGLVMDLGQVSELTQALELVLVQVILKVVENV